ncbi:MAG: DMT family transporter [Candidatus Thermoplasmatota archaeon]|nr:DMT family transporter [Candidatus Thermoplasmatota archaeon]MCL5437712.1 DMT family transporter [Candidatus Thermoplasmatota archaeon]
MDRKLFYLSLLFLVTFFWGVTFPLIKESLAYVSAVYFLFFRFLISALLMVPFLLRSREFLNRSSFRHGMIAGFILFLGYYFQTVGLEYTTASRSGIITGLYVVLIPLLTFVLLRSRPSATDTFASAFSFAGLVIMSVGTVGNASIQLGDILSVACAVAYAFQIMYVSRYSRDLETWSFTFYQLLAVAVFSGVMIPFSGPQVLSFPFIVVFTLLFTAIFAGMLAVYISNKALIHVEASAAGVIFVGEPIIAALASVIMLGENLSLYTVTGGSIMVLSMFITTYDRYRRGRKRTAGAGTA